MKNAQSLVYTISPYIFIAGSYEKNRINDTFCKLLGFDLAKHNLGVISAGGRPGLQVSYSLSKALSDFGNYDAMKIVTCYRKKDKEDIMKVKRVGCKLFIGKDLPEMRQEMLFKTRALITIGGSAGTKEEITMAEKYEIPVIPIGMTGGTSHETWKKYFINYNEIMSNKRGNNKLAFENLNHKNPHIAKDAALSFIKSIFLLD